MRRGIVTLAALLCFAAQGFSQAKERKNIDKLTPQELAAYKHAVGILQKSTDPKNNYSYHANLHNLFLNTPPHGCEHGNDLFFPWHRYHLANFEKALQATDPDHATLSTKDVTVPYWEWTKPASGNRLPKDFENSLDAGVPNPLFDDFRNTDPSAPIYDEAYMTAIVRNNPDWNQFAGGPKDVSEFYGAFESPSHNTMHSTYIGGTMADPTSAALDPIYWSFHAFIDMQWDRWQKIHNKPPTSQDKVLRGFTNSPKAAATVDVNALGYFYTHTPESIAPLLEAPPAKLEPRALRLVSDIPGAERAVAVWGGAGPFVFKLPDAKGFHRADLWLDGIRIPESFSYRAEFFIHLVGEKYKPADSAGSLTVWKGHTALGEKNHHTQGNMFLTVTDSLRKAIAANPGKELAVTIAVTPIQPAARPKAAKPVLLAVEDEVQFKSVRLLLDGGGPLQAGAKGGGHGH